MFSNTNRSLIFGWLYLFAISLLCPCCVFASLPDETLFLTWQREPEGTMTVQWVSHVNETATSVIYWKEGSLEPPLCQTGVAFPFPHAPDTLLHRVELTHLIPNTRYTFTRTFGGEEFHFKTAPSSLKDPIHFVVGGDMYHDTVEHVAKTSKVAAKTDPLFAVVGGDIAYAVRNTKEDVPRWIEWIKIWHQTMVTEDLRLIPVIAALGNHDIIGQFGQTSEQAAIFSALFPMPGEQIFNVLDFCDYLSFIILDSGHAHSIDGVQTEWLNSVLEMRSGIKHRFAIYHVPAYPSVRKPNNRYSTAIRKYWVPLFEKWRLHAAFEHHDHAYKRTYPLLRDQIHPQGIIYLGDGAWGVDKPRIQKRAVPGIAKFAPVRHVISVTLTENGQNFKCLSEDGVLVDEYSQFFAPSPHLEVSSDLQLSERK